MGQTVNLLLRGFVGSNPTLPTERFADVVKTILLKRFAGNAKHPQIERSEICGNSSIGRATAFQAVGCGFETRFPLKKNKVSQPM